MFIEKDKVQNRIGTLIGEHCFVNGSLKGDDLLKVDGSIDGDINWEGDIILGITSFCKGNIYCKNATIEGRLEGNITCDEILLIENSGSIKGDIFVRNIVIKEGGLLEGKCNMMPSKNIVEENPK